MDLDQILLRYVKHGAFCYKLFHGLSCGKPSIEPLPCSNYQLAKSYPWIPRGCDWKITIEPKGFDRKGQWYSAKRLDTTLKIPYSDIFDLKADNEIDIFWGEPWYDLGKRLRHQARTPLTTITRFDDFNPDVFFAYVDSLFWVFSYRYILEPYEKNRFPSYLYYLKYIKSIRPSKSKDDYEIKV